MTSTNHPDHPRNPTDYGEITSPVLTIRDLSVHFAGHHAKSGPRSAQTTVVDSVSFHIEKGETLALVGESGSGKSTIARSVIGLLPDNATADGAITVAGTEMVGASDNELQEVRGTTVAMVFQEPQTALDPVRTIGWQLTQALLAHAARSDTSSARTFARRDARNQAIELLRTVGLPDPETRIDWFPHQLSGGQKQRVVIALAMSGEPDLLIADEPTTALDVTVQAEILNLLRDLQNRTGTALLLITHNLGVVADIADRVVVLKGGSVVEQAEVHDLFSRPATQYTRELLAAVPRLDMTTNASADPLPSREPILRLNDVGVAFSEGRKKTKFHALVRVSLEIGPHEVLGVVGESGSGKTTLSRVALGLQPLSTGQGQIFGHDLSELRSRRARDLRRRIAVVHQDPAASLDPLCTVSQSIREPLIVHGLERGADDQVAELLDAVELPANIAHRRPGELSGGQRQRVALARALILKPQLLVADEPTSALDVSVQQKILELFADVRARFGFACLFISHDLAVVNSAADRVVVLRHGEIVESGVPSAVFHNPSHPYTRSLVDAVPVPDPVVQRAKRRTIAVRS